MEAKTELKQKKIMSGFKLRHLLSSAALLFISGIAKAAIDSTAVVKDSLKPDSLANDTMNALNKAKGLRSLDEGGVLTYTLIVVGIIVIIGFAFVTSMRKNKQSSGAPVGYRKPHTHHKHNHKI